ncbi:efflux RND transporter periplasmic adaptor subunit [Vibrio sp. MA40-2]|uniref:efflux RND transporter periplasmic adaptor subunit n=1 Tax=Vibrio sp. MA40-2 TaxID=3391828 RepID=UPI0039A42CE8
MKNIKLVAFIVSFIASTTTASYAAGPQRSSKPKSILVVTEQVATHQVAQTLTLVGKLEAEESVVISPEVSGKIDVINVKANQKVRQGDLLVQLNDDKAKAAISEASAYLRDEKRKLTEYQRLAKKGAITQTEIDAQKASVDIANARLDAVYAQLKDLHISAPFAGTIGFIDFSRGKMVNSGTELLTLDNLSSMRLDLQVPERFLSMLSNGMIVDATSSAWQGVTFEGEVTGIDTRINSETLNLRVRIKFDNANNQLKPGMLMSATIEFPAIDAPIIPVQALQYSGTKRYVYVVDSENKAKKTEVVLGARIENEVVITKGLQIGERIVVQGIVNMRDGSLVEEQATRSAKDSLDKSDREKDSTEEDKTAKEAK